PAPPAPRTTAPTTTCTVAPCTWKPATSSARSKRHRRIDATERPRLWRGRFFCFRRAVPDSGVLSVRPEDGRDAGRTGSSVCDGYESAITQYIASCAIYYSMIMRDMTYCKKIVAQLFSAVLKS